MRFQTAMAFPGGHAASQLVGFAWAVIASRLLTLSLHVLLWEWRLGLHPVDMRHRASRDYWLNTLHTLLAQGREPLTKSTWLDRQASV